MNIIATEDTNLAIDSLASERVQAQELRQDFVVLDAQVVAVAELELIRLVDLAIELQADLIELKAENDELHGIVDYLHGEIYPDVAS